MLVWRIGQFSFGLDLILPSNFRKRQEKLTSFLLLNKTFTLILYYINMLQFVVSIYKFNEYWSNWASQYFCLHIVIQALELNLHLGFLRIYVKVILHRYERIL